MKVLQYGTASTPLSDFVREYSLEQGNIKQTAIAQNLKRAELVYKDLFRQTLWEVKEVVLFVDPQKNTIKLPDNMARLISISVVDALGKKQLLTYNSAFNTVEILCPTVKCSCSTCGGDNTLCATLDAIAVTTNPIIIGDQTYTQTIRMRSDRCGDIQQEIITPCLNVVTGKVEYNTEYKTVCNVDVTEQGCIQPTAPNLQTIIDYIGYPINGFFGIQSPILRQLIPVSFNYYGEWNYNSAARDIIHIFRPKPIPGLKQGPTVINPYSGQQETLQNDIDKVILCYQTNGEEPGAEILIPDYAEFAMKIGMSYRTEQLRPRPNMSAVNQLKWAYKEQKHIIAKYLNPINIADLAKMQTQPKYW